MIYKYDAGDSVTVKDPRSLETLCVPKTSHGDFRVKGQKIISA